MPFKSEAQRRWMWKHHPQMARRWQEHTPKGKRLPRKLTANIASPTKSDPSRTSWLRKRFEREIVKRYTKLKQAIYDLVFRQDAFGLKDRPKSKQPTFNSLLDYVKYVFNFNPNQPRDYRGRWTSGGQAGHIAKSELKSLKERFGAFAKLPELSVALVKSIDTSGSIGLADTQATLGSQYVHGKNHIDLLEELPDDPTMKLGGDTTYQGVQGLFRHEVGHHVQEHAHKILGPPLTDEGKRISWQNLAQEYVGKDKPSVISDYAKLSHKELYAESFAVFTDPNYKSGSLPKPIESYFTKLLDPIPKPTVNTRWKFRTSSIKLEEFRRWLQEQIALEIIPDEDDPSQQDEWWEKYVTEAYEKGVLRAFTDAQAKLLSESSIAYDARKEQFLRDSFVQPESREKVQLLASRVFTDLKGVTDVMSQQMSQVLVEGLSSGSGPMEIARKLNDRVEHIGITRSRVIARTEILRAHNEGQLDAFERMGVEEVGVAVEYDTAGDGRVCKLCSAMDGVVLTVKESRGLLPRHPQCRCVYLPANVGESTKGQIRGKQGIQSAIDESIEREIPKGSKRTLAEQKARTKWGGADTKISKKRPKSIV